MRKRVSIIYDSMYGSTARVAQAIGEGVKEAGAEFEILDLKSSNLTNVAASLYRCPVMALGSPTLNSTMMPPLAAAIQYAGGLQLIKNKDVALFGAFGWAEKATKDIADMTTKFGGKP